MPFYPAAGDLAESYLGEQMVEAFTAPCAVWPHTPAEDAVRQPIASSVPTLLLSGEYDPVTPPANGEIVSETFPNSLHIVAPGQGHNVFFRGCLPTLTAEFVASADPGALDTTCVERLDAPPFFLRFTGP
ncbi:MAG: alpha/beta fold hydrolase [Oscillochloris sp.]|nr:alpha/beta fold hydrolase [Oscillochloris sp.]